MANWVQYLYLFQEKNAFWKVHLKRIFTKTLQQLRLSHLLAPHISIVSGMLCNIHKYKHETGIHQLWPRIKPGISGTKNQEQLGHDGLQMKRKLSNLSHISLCLHGPYFLSLFSIHKSQLILPINRYSYNLVNVEEC